MTTPAARWGFVVQKGASRGGRAALEDGGGGGRFRELLSLQVASRRHFGPCSCKLLKEALINLQKLLRAIKEHQTRGILQRFPEILKWGYAPRFGEPSGCRSLPLTGRQSQSPRASRGLMKFQALKGAHTVDSSQRLNQCFLRSSCP